MKSRDAIIIPLAVSAVLLLSLLTLGITFGDDFQGGTLLMVRGVKNDPDINYIRPQVEILTGSIVTVRKDSDGFDIQTNTLSGETENMVKEMLLTSFNSTEISIMSVSIGPTVSDGQAVQILIIGLGALVAMVIIILIFRRRLATATVLITAGMNILGILGLMALFRVALSLSSVIGILITIGYAIDTNALLTSRLLKGAAGDPRENIGETLKTGIIISAVALAIILSINILVTAVQIKELTFAIIFGLIINVINTWFLSAAVILRRIEKRKVMGYHVGI